MTDASGGNRRPPHHEDVLDDDDDETTTESEPHAAEESPTTEAESRPTEAAPTGESGQAAEDDLAPPPERPSLSDDRRPPVLKIVPPPRSVKTSRILWLLSFTAAAAAMLIAFLSHESIAAELEETLLRLAPGYDESSISSLVDGIYWACIASLGVVVTVEAVLLAMLLNRRGGARWAQLPLLLLHAGAAIVGSAFLTVAEFGLIVAALLLGSLALAVIAWIASLFPGANRWFRTRGEVQPATLH
jgi:hypothetical protein